MYLDISWLAKTASSGLGLCPDATAVAADTSASGRGNTIARIISLFVRMVLQLFATEGTRSDTSKRFRKVSSRISSGRYRTDRHGHPNTETGDRTSLKKTIGAYQAETGKFGTGNCPNSCLAETCFGWTADEATSSTYWMRSWRQDSNAVDTAE